MSEFLFTDDYEVSRTYFRETLKESLGNWKHISFQSVATCEDCSIDSYQCTPFTKKEKLLLLTTGEHGIEAYAGITFLDIFLKEFLPLLDRNRIGLWVLSPINPWGMKYHRRTNEHNVDLNRNFVVDWNTLDKNINPAYQKVLQFVNDKRKITTWMTLRPIHFFRTLRLLNKIGMTSFLEAVTIGQYKHPDGIYYGSTEYETSTEYMLAFFEEAFSSYPEVLHIDIHTGAGKKNRMTIVDSAFCPEISADQERAFHYQPVVKTTKEEFYNMSGDMIDYLYQKIPKKSPHTRFYSTCFEYGIVGESFFGRVKSNQAIIQENQGFHHGYENQKQQRLVQQRFERVFYSHSQSWQKAMIADTRKALLGILRSKKYIR